DFMLPGPPHPYVGILLFLILPALFLFGLIFIPIGIFFRRRKLLAAGELPTMYPAIDMKMPAVRNGLLFVGVATFLNVMIFGFASYRGVAYMDTVSFCGQSCHTPMAPEFNAYQNAPHSQVACAECHIGPGAGWFVRAKISGMRQLYAVTFKTYPTPIPAPVKNPRLTTAVVLNIGGLAAAGYAGIHGRHLDDGSRIRYISIDDQRQVIPVV